MNKNICCYKCDYMRVIEGTYECIYPNYPSEWGKVIEYRFGVKCMEDPEWCPQNMPKYDVQQKKLVEIEKMRKKVKGFLRGVEDGCW